MNARAACVALCAAFAPVACGADASDGAAPQVPGGFTISVVAHVDAPRELAALPNGDLIAGTSRNAVVLIPDADGTPGAPVAFATIADREAAGVAYANGTIYVGSHTGVWRIAYRDGDRSAHVPPQRIATVRPGNGGGHSTTSVAVAKDELYASVGSSCNACTETDPTRAKVFEMALDGSGMRPRAERIRNAIALAVNPATDALWAGVAGQDDLAHGHPYEIFDDVTVGTDVRDYGWPACFEDRSPVAAGNDCSQVAVPRVVFPAYETPIGAAFYPQGATGAHVFPAAYRGGAFVALHGSWHQPPVPPRVVYVPIDGNDRPATAVRWNDPDAQWKPFVTGFQNADGSRSGRPTGVTVGSDGSLFVADDEAGAIYRIRPR